MGLKSRTVVHAGQTFMLHAIPGDLAHDNKGRIIGHLSAAVAQIPGVSLSLLLAMQSEAVEVDGAMVSRGEIMRDLGRVIGINNLADAVSAIFARMTSVEVASLRTLLLSSATVSGPRPGDSDMVSVPVLDALKRNDLAAGALVVDWLLWEAITLSILPFTEIDGSAVRAAMAALPALPSKGSTT